MLLLRLYQGALRRFPTLTQATTVGTLLPLGDAISQRFIEGRKTQDFQRSARFALLGFCFIGPVQKHWIYFLEKTFEPRGWGIIKKVLTDQAFFAPALNLCVISGLEKMQGKDWTSVWTKLKNTYPDVMRNSYKLWPAVSFINFYVIPLQYRVLFVTVVALFWNIYLTWRIRPEEE
jgi:hypothetical protein